MIATLGTAAVLAAGPTFVPSPAPVDHRPCVSKREFNSADTVERRAVLEHRWEVRGLGQQVKLPLFGRVTIYPRCGYSMDEAWYGQIYVLNDYGHRLAVASVWWSDREATPHGRP